MRVNEVILVLASEVASVEHVLTETVGGSGCILGIGRLADRDMLSEESGSQLVDQLLHVDQHLG